VTEIPLRTLLIVFVVLVVMSAFFSSSETSMMALNRYRLRHLAKTGNRGAKRTVYLLDRTDRLLGSILLGNNLVNTAAAALGTTIVFRLLGQSQLSLTIATLSVTAVFLVFSEITPKILGASYPEKIAFPASLVLKPLMTLMHPVVVVANLFVNGLLLVFKLKPAGASAHMLSPEELRTLVLEGGHFLPQKHQTMLLNLFDLESITVEDVMTPRSKIEGIDLDASPEEIRREIATCNHTRLPVYRSRLDDVVGVVHIRKVLNLSDRTEIDANTITEIMKAPYFVPIETGLLAQLQNFQDQQDRFALIVDEYGDLMGLVTIEDILEEIIGEFTTQSPMQAADWKRLEDGSVVVDGAASLRDLNRQLGYEFPVDGPKTLNGLLLEHLQEIPEPGTSLKVEGCPVEILQVQHRSIKSVRLPPPETTPSENK
jgi:Mg2+/Co2+ transporter CorB